jgi:NADP-dependent alcohol dehydrogenase
MAKTKEKLNFSSPTVFPKFSIIDPQTHLSLPKRQIRNGIIDAFVHVAEQYMTFPSHARLQDRQAEAILSCLLEIGPLIINDPGNLELRNDFAWAASNALNGLIGVGVPHDWSTHMIGHELTALYGLDHAETLALVLPGVWRHQKRQKQTKLIQFGNRVLGLSQNGQENDNFALTVIHESQKFFSTLNPKTRLSDYGIQAEEAAKKIGDRFRSTGTKLGEHQNIDANAVEEILRSIS